MKYIGCSNLASLATLLLAFAVSPAPAAQTFAQTANPIVSQSSGQKASKPAPSATSSNSSAQPCENLTTLEEQLRGQARILRQQLDGKLAGMEARLQADNIVSPSEVERLEQLSAKLQDQQGDFQALTANAQSERAHFFAQRSGVFPDSADEGTGWLGIEIGEVTAEIAKDRKLSSERGVVVTGIEPDSPAAKAGLKDNDVIMQYDGENVEGTVQFRRLVRETPPNRAVMLAVMREGRTQNISVQLGDRGQFLRQGASGSMDNSNVYFLARPNLNMNLFRSGEPGSLAIFDTRSPILGISGEDLSGQLGEYFGAPSGEGVLVRSVRTGTPAEKAGLKAGDVITSVNGKTVRALAELRQQLDEKAGDTPIQLGLIRKGSKMAVAIAVEKPRPVVPVQAIHHAQI